MLHLNAIRKAYRTGNNTLQVLKGIDLHIGTGELVSIMGQSGSGKSTLLNIIGILDNYDSGEYKLDGMLIKGQSETESAL
ncbi:MAG TPA: ATP-binding cassette domain-containing protein, partial [Flavobacteriales bacterium]